MRRAAHVLMLRSARCARRLWDWDFIVIVLNHLVTASATAGTGSAARCRGAPKAVRTRLGTAGARLATGGAGATYMPATEPLRVDRDVARKSARPFVRRIVRTVRGAAVAARKVVIVGHETRTTLRGKSSHDLRLVELQPKIGRHKVDIPGGLYLVQSV